MDGLDADHNGLISLSEFTSFCRFLAGRVSELRNVFDLYDDQDNNGPISAAELQLVLKRLGVTCSVEDCGRMIVPVDATCDGNANFEKMITNSKPSACTYEVFLSFRGEDTRTSFTDHLYSALNLAGIRTFRDDDGIESGENIKAELEKAIQQTRASIIVFSKDFASSDWCLDELLMILERRRTVGHMVLPVFYKVGPSQVRNQSGTFQDAFARHERCLDEDTVKRWREGLREVTCLKGMVLPESQGESHFIQDIVKEIEKKLMKPTITKSCTKDIKLLSQDDSDKVGLGKKTVYGLSIDKLQAQVGPFMERAATDVILDKILLGVQGVKLAMRKVTQLTSVNLLTKLMTANTPHFVGAT